MAGQNMPSPLESLVATGTKLWLDSVDPDLVAKFKKLGATGATSNPIIISDLIKTGRFDDDLQPLFDKGLSDEEVAWEMTDKLVSDAQETFRDSFEKSKGETGYVSFELDPLLEDIDNPMSVEDRADRYVALGKRWSKGHVNRMIKVPATPAGLAALERLAAEGVTLNVTLIFSDRQYHEARDAIWRGAQKRKNGLDAFKSVYSIFVSRIDVYTKKQVPELSPAAQGQVGILNVKRMWAENEAWWADKNLRLKQEIVFASTGVKEKGEPADKYVSALAGSDIQTNPPDTNEAIHKMVGKTFSRTVDQLPPKEIVSEIDQKVDFKRLEEVLMSEGTKKFADPHKALLKLIAEKRATLTAAK